MRYKLFFLLVGMFVVISESKAQTEQYCVHYPYNTQVGINLNVNMLSKMRLESLSDYFRSNPSIGTGLGVYLYQRVYKWFGIQVGAEYSLNTIYCGGTANFTELPMRMMTFPDAFTFPVLFNASYYFNEKYGLNISLGGVPLILPPPSSSAHNSYTLGYGKLNKDGDYCGFALGNEERFSFSLYGKIGYNLLFKNKNTLGMAITGSYATIPYGQGKYFVDMNDGTRVEDGSISLYNIFVGLQFSYGFTMKKLLCNPVNN